MPIARADGGGRPPGGRRRRRAQTPQAGGAIRRLWPSELSKVRDHLLRLGRDDRLLRFGNHASAARITAHCARVDWSRGLILGYVTGGKARGIGELALLGTGWPRAAELAVSVERRFQNRGIGTALLRRLVVAARNRLIERIHMVCLIDNGRAVRMARRLDGTMRVTQGEAEARIEPPWPTPWTWLEEALPESTVPGLDRERAALSRP
jgi:RimJ/RimL family protein N-acetyltransferase